MKYRYKIQGITCNNCIEKITNLLKEQMAATNILFTNKNTELDFVANSDIKTSDLNEILATIGNYKIYDIGNDTPLEDHVSYKPIYLIFLYLIITNILIALPHFTLSLFMSNFMAGFFLIFSFFKMLDLRGFASGYSNYDLIAKKFYGYGFIYPFIELAFALFYLLTPTNLYLNIVVFIVMLISTIGVITAKLKKQQFHCACVGTFLKVPLGNIAIIEDILMVSMSLAMILIML